MFRHLVVIFFYDITVAPICKRSSAVPFRKHARNSTFQNAAVGRRSFPTDAQRRFRIRRLLHPPRVALGSLAAYTSSMRPMFKPHELHF